MSMKKKLQLSTLVKVQKFLEDLISTQQKYISEYNDTEMKIESALQTMTEAEVELIKVKEVVQEANKAKHADGKTNNYYIYRLYNLNVRKKFLQSLKPTDKSQLSQKEIDKELAEIDKEINEIRKKLTEFNSKEVSIELNETIVSIL